MKLLLQYQRRNHAVKIRPGADTFGKGICSRMIFGVHDLLSAADCLFNKDLDEVFLAPFYHCSLTA